MIINREASGFVLPGVITDIVAETDYKKCFGWVTRFMDIDETSAYVNRIKVASEAKITQSWTSERTNQNITSEQMKTPRYLISAEYRGNEVSEKVFEKSVKGVSYRSLLDTSCVAAISQKLRYGALYGFQDGQGLLSQATLFGMGKDQNNKEILDQMNAMFIYDRIGSAFAEILGASKQRAEKIVVLAAIPTFNLLNKKFAELLSSQKDGGGIDTIGGMLHRIAKNLNIELEIGVDSTLKGAGTGGKDVMLIVCPTLKKSPFGDEFNVNAIEEGTNSINANTHIDIGAGGRAIHTMLPLNMDGQFTFGGAHTARVTPGAVFRKEMVYKMEFQTLEN